MKFALYHPWIYLHGGIERSLLELVQRSHHDWTIFTGFYDAEHTFSDFRSLNVRELRKTSVKRSYTGVLASTIQTFMQKLPVDDDTDAIVVWCDGIGDMLTFRNRSLPVFNICSTPLRAAFDPVYEHLALRQRSLAARLPYWFLKHAFRVIDRRAWRNYTGVITTSAEVKKRIIQGRLLEDEKRMVMAHPGVDWSADISDVEYQPYILMPGRIMWTKNIEQGIRAFLKANLPQPWRLVVAGFVDAKSTAYLQALQRIAGHDERVVFCLSPTDQQLSDLYRTASFCLFTPLNEDWGIVPLEAMARGKPVVAIARGGPTESIVHEKTGYLLEPGDDDGWAQTIARLALTPGLARQMGIVAHDHVKRYSWNQFASTVDEALLYWMEAAAMEATAMDGSCRESDGDAVAP
jgi:glycosyltransferase involved in cell wall biosynthesis